MLIDCDHCAARPAACSDCVVGVLLGVPEVPARPAHGDDGPAAGEVAPGEREPADGAALPVEFGPVERRALEVLADHGLIPRLRLVHAVPDAPAAHRSGQAVRARRDRDAG